MRRLPIPMLVALAVLAAACSSDEAAAPATTEPAATAAPTQPPPTPASTEAPATTAEPTTTVAETTTTAAVPETTEAAAGDNLDARGIVEALAADDLSGRDNESPGSLLAQQLLVEQLSAFAEPAVGEGDDGYLQPFDLGTNVVGLIPGGDLADEYVVIGAHYDHLGTDCASSDPTDDICNGAVDNAAGVAVAMSAARAVAAAGVPRRSVIVAFWDAEEDGLFGSAAYLANPVVPLAQTVAYINFDNQGQNLLPSLATTTVMVGAETGGANLVDAATRATEASALDTVALSVVFGQGRSDHANFVNAGVPAVFFTDATNGCYHTAQDEVGTVDFAKLDEEVATATALLTDLVATDAVPVLDPAAPLTTYDDAVSMLQVTTTGEPDLDLLSPAAQASTRQYIADLQAIVDAGPDAFDDDAIGTLLGGAVTLVEALTETECDGYLPAPP